MSDRIETFGQSTLQHGPHSDRVYLMDLAEADLPELLPYLDDLAARQGYTKIFAKVPAPWADHFLEDGYEVEARIPGLIAEKTDGLFLGKYLSDSRRREKKEALVRQVISAASAKQSKPGHHTLAENLACRLCLDDDCEAMASLYREVFASYPFPIHDPAYLRETMASHILYYGIWQGDQLLALASAELDRRKGNAEMTDFATSPEARGKGLAQTLLTKLEEGAAAEGIQTAYTIARAYSMGMNITFARAGYTYCGTLTHNTQISGGLESMNVWYKPLTFQNG
ncbi:MAG: putative beta-lysine N-acetyltransferase [Desulfuromonas sp.]|nr:MAG: putative beta-lysine N-acetyltransferase [Desulfuromonas sp.]